MSHFERETTVGGSPLGSLRLSPAQWLVEDSVVKAVRHYVEHYRGEQGRFAISPMAWQFR